MEGLMKNEINIILRALKRHISIAAIICQLNVIVLGIHKGDAQAIDCGALNVHLIEHLLLLLLAQVLALRQLFDLSSLISADLQRCYNLVDILVQLFHVEDAHLLLIAATDAETPKQLRDGQVNLTIICDGLGYDLAAQSEGLINFLNNALIFLRAHRRRV